MTLQEYLDKTDLSDQAFARRVGVTQSYVSRMRRGLVHPSVGIAVRVHRASKRKVDIETLVPTGFSIDVGGGDRQAV